MKEVIVGDQLRGQVAVIIGGSSGMGEATGKLFALEGAKVALAGRNKDALYRIVAEIKKGGGEASAIPTDAQDQEAVQKLIDGALGAYGRIDILVYSTGTNITERSLAVVTKESWDMVISTNLSGAFYATKAVLPAMRKQGKGLIIYIASVAVPKPDISGVAYQASKHGMCGLAFATMVEEKTNGIRTSVIYPGIAHTPIVKKRPVPPPPEVLAKALQAEDIAAACLFIASLPPRAHVPELHLSPSQL